MVTVNETAFLQPETHIWHKRITESIQELLNNLRDSCENETEARALTELIIEFGQAVRTFEMSVADLNTIMNCRAKCDPKSNFGGHLCQKLAKDIRACCEKYIKTMRSDDQLIDSPNIATILEIKNTAKNDEELAKHIALQSQALYEQTGQDNSKEIFKNSGYLA